MKFVPLVSLAAALLSLCGICHADPTTYSLVNVSFNDGGIATGTLFYDPVANKLFNFDITVTPGTSMSAFEYNPSTASFTLSGLHSGLNSFLLFDPGRDRSFDLQTNGRISGTTDSIDVFLGSFEGCTNLPCVGDGRSVVSGEIVATPEPSGLVMLGSGLLVSGAALRRKLLTR